MTFAIITPALIVGAYVERVGFGFVLLFSALWILVVYAPVAHWIWGGGACRMAGSLVRSACATLPAASWCMKPQAWPRCSSPWPWPAQAPHHPAASAADGDDRGGDAVGRLVRLQRRLGAGRQWARPPWRSPSRIFRAAAAGLTWALWERIKFGRASLVGLVTGTIAGLASITPASGFVGPVAALVIGGVAGVLCQEAVVPGRKAAQIDDTLDVFGGPWRGRHLWHDHGRGLGRGHLGGATGRAGAGRDLDRRASPWC